MNEQKQSREDRRLILIVIVVRDFIKELASYNPRVLVRVIQLVISRKHITSLGRPHEVHLPCKSITAWFLLLSVIFGPMIMSVVVQVDFVSWSKSLTYSE